MQEAARRVGVSERTIHRYLTDEQFQLVFKEAKMRLLDAAILKLRNGSSDAVDTLIEILKDACAPHAARVAAARSVIQLAIEAEQVQDVEKRLHQLEQRTINGSADWSSHEAQVSA